MIAFIEDQRVVYGVESICRVLPIAPSTFYHRLACRADPSKASARQQRDTELQPEIKRVWDENYQVYGVRKAWHQLKREGFTLARCTVERLMKQLSIRGAVRGKVVKTTVPDTSAPCPRDKVNRVFRATAPNLLWVSDFTYVSTWQGFVYVAFVIDTFADRIVGWRVSRSAKTDFVLDALEQALHDRRPVQKGGLVHHSDRDDRLNLPNICPFDTPIVWLKLALSHRSAASVTATTTPSLKRSMVSTKPSWFTARAHGATCRIWNWPPSAGSTGSTTGACLAPSETSRQQSPKRPSMHSATDLPLNFHPF